MRTIHALAALAGVMLLVGGFLMAAKPLSMDERRLAYIDDKNSIIDEMRAQGNYRCCLEKACTYCIEKSPGHGEDASCTCLDDVMGGRHPCGECIGEILEGHGNPYISEYFALAIAEEVGQQHLGTLKQIIEEKYGTPVSQQIDGTTA